MNILLGKLRDSEQRLFTNWKGNISLFEELIGLYWDSRPSALRMCLCTFFLNWGNNESSRLNEHFTRNNNNRVGKIELPSLQELKVWNNKYCTSSFFKSSNQKDHHIAQMTTDGLRHPVLQTGDRTRCVTKGKKSKQNSRMILVQGCPGGSVG